MTLHFNFTTYYYLFGTVILFFLYWRIRSILKKDALNRFTKLFGNVVLFCVIATTIYSVFFISFGNNPFYLWLGNTIGQPFLIVGFVYGLSIFFLVIKPKISSSKIVIPLAILGAVLCFFLHLKYPFSPSFDKYGFLHWNASLLVGLNYSIFSVIGFLPLSIALLIKGIKNKEIRFRSLFLSFALILFIVDSITFSMSESRNLYIFGNICVNLGFIFLITAYFLQRGKSRSISDY